MFCCKLSKFFDCRKTLSGFVWRHKCHKYFPKVSDHTPQSNVGSNLWHNKAFEQEVANTGLNATLYVSLDSIWSKTSSMTYVSSTMKCLQKKRSELIWLVADWLRCQNEGDAWKRPLDAPRPWAADWTTWPNPTEPPQKGTVPIDP